jgi:hypothetical protein
VLCHFKCQVGRDVGRRIILRFTCDASFSPKMVSHIEATRDDRGSERT